jgi:hypothetical protein
MDRFAKVFQHGSRLTPVGKTGSPIEQDRRTLVPLDGNPRRAFLRDGSRRRRPPAGELPEAALKHFARA